MAKSSLFPSARTPTLVRRAEIVGSEGTSYAHLWQMPLLLLSLGLFTLAAYLFIDPRPAPSLQRQLAIAERDIDTERFDAAIGRLNDLLATRPEKLEEAHTRLLIAEALDKQIRRNRRQESPQAYRRIVSEIHAAYAAGVAATSDTSDRLARSHEALGQIDEASANYRRAAELLEQEQKPERAVPMRRSAIEMLVAADRDVNAADALRQFMQVPGLTDDEQAWALGELARIRFDGGQTAEAKSLLAAALALSPDDAIRGQVNFRLGYAGWRLGEPDEAQRYLLLARQQLGAGHPLEPEACYLLGRLAQDREAMAEAMELYQEVVRDHPDSRAAPKAQLACGTVRLLMGDVEQGAAELMQLAGEAGRRPALAPIKPELLSALGRASRIVANRGNYELALELTSAEQALAPRPEGQFLGQRGLYLEKLAGQVETQLAAAEVADRAALTNRLQELRRQAGEAFVAASQQLLLAADAGYAAALWKGIALLESGGAEKQVVAALEQFCSSNPADAMAPEVLLRLAGAYESGGLQFKATQTLLQLRQQHPESAAAMEAALPLAQALIAQGEPRYEEAERLLRSVVDAVPAPTSQTLRPVLWELGHLYYRTARYDEAAAHLEAYAQQATETDAADPARAAQLAFLRADCLRKSAAERIAEASQPADPLRPHEPDAQLASSGANESAAFRSARKLFDETIAHYRESPAMTPLDQMYERLAWFYRADCLYDLGEYEEAITLYEAAANRYRDDPSTLAAYVQLGNAYAALGRTREASAANDRARWLLKRVPREAFTDGRFTLSRDYWEQWLKASGQTDAG